MRGSSLAYGFSVFVREIFGNTGDPLSLTNNFLFDLAHAIARNDAKVYGKKMGLK